MNRKPTFILAQYLCLALLLTSLVSCDDEGEPIQNISDSFLPMEIGNYWKTDESNFVEITDTLRIDGDLYYLFYSLTGGDVIGKQYLRIDEEQQLIEAIPRSPGFRFTHAKFDIPQGDTFWTINDQSVNDFKVTLVIKEDDFRIFEQELIYHPNLSTKRQIIYARGFGKNVGVENGYKEVRISGKVYNF